MAKACRGVMEMNCYRKRGKTAVAFGFGLIAACFFPDRFIICIAAIVIIVLGIGLATLRC